MFDGRSLRDSDLLASAHGLLLKPPPRLARSGGDTKARGPCRNCSPSGRAGIMVGGASSPSVEGRPAQVLTKFTAEGLAGPCP